jgi:cell shape-determining protein MreC
MKPVRRRIRRHFGLTAKQVAVRSKRPWYFQWSITILYVVVGYAIAYWQFAGAEDVHQKLKQTALENQSLHTKIIQVERQLQIEQAAQTSLAQELNKVQDENMHIKQDLVFYKNMTNGKRLPK